MSLNKQNILGIGVTVNKKDDILKYLKSAIKKSNRPDFRSKSHDNKILTVLTPNPEQVVLARKMPWFREFLNRAEIAIPDGVGLVRAAGRLGLPGPLARVSGSDLMLDLVNMAEKEGVRIGFIGGGDGIALKALECLRKTHPDLAGAAINGPQLQVTGTGCRIAAVGINNFPSEQDNYQKQKNGSANEIQEIADWIRKERLGIVFVGMGAPKQEWLIRSVIETIGQKNNLRMMMSVGGAFDMIAGRTPRAPVWVRKMGLEWLWRLTLEPWRVGRQLRLLEFVYLVVREKFIV